MCPTKRHNYTVARLCLPRMAGSASVCIEGKQRHHGDSLMRISNPTIQKQTYLERYFGADRRDEHTNLVSLVINLVRTPAEITSIRWDQGDE